MRSWSSGVSGGLRLVLSSAGSPIGSEPRGSSWQRDARAFDTPSRAPSRLPLRRAASVTCSAATGATASAATGSGGSGAGGSAQVARARPAPGAGAPVAEAPRRRFERNGAVAVPVAVSRGALGRARVEASRHSGGTLAGASR